MLPFKSALGRRAVLAYGTGHMLNDLTAACWFTYLLIFLTDVGLSPREAAIVMMAGQLADAVSTLVVGRLIDGFGHFKRWHAGGSALVALSFSSVFGGCLACAVLGTSSDVARTVSYSLFAAIFNCGWAATQVSHMSLVNCITANPTSRVALNSCRNAFTMIANLALYGIAYVAFWALPGSDPLTVQTQFRWIAGGAIGLGLLLVLVFQAGVAEPKLYHIQASSAAADGLKLEWTAWFKRALYYEVALVYTLTRLTTNISQAMLLFFLVDDLKMPLSSKATVPAAVYLSSFVASIVLQEMHWTGKRLKMVFVTGAALWFVAGFEFFRLTPDHHLAVYVLSVVVGIGNAFMLVTATSMEGVLVGQDVSGCAFVYGSLSFLDKLTCGIALYLIEDLNVPHSFCSTTNGGSCHRSMVQWVLTVVPGGCAVLAALTTLWMNLEERPDDASSLSSLKEPLVVGPPSSRAAELLLDSHGHGQRSLQSRADAVGVGSQGLLQDMPHMQPQQLQPHASSRRRRLVTGEWASDEIVVADRAADAV